jgi:hypothetical protein
VTDRIDYMSALDLHLRWQCESNEPFITHRARTGCETCVWDGTEETLQAAVVLMKACVDRRERGYVAPDDDGYAEGVSSFIRSLDEDAMSREVWE